MHTITLKTLLHYLFFLLCIFPALSGAEEFNASLSVSPKNGGIKDRFLMEITINGVGSASGIRPQIHSSPDFRHVYVGPSSSVQIINGVVSQKLQYSYQLKAKKTGLLISPSATIQYNGRTYQLPGQKIKVSKTSPSTLNRSKNSSVRVQQKVSDSEVFIGQQIVNSVELLFRVEVRDPVQGDFTSDGFWQVDISNDEQGRTTYQGEPYRYLRVKKALFPLEKGKFVIPPREFELSIPDESRTNPFNRRQFPFGSGLGMGMFQQFKRVTLASNSVNVTVIPLPSHPENKNAAFVGLSSLTGGERPITLEVGESETISFILTSDGNLSGIKDLSLKEPQGLQIYADAPTEKSYENLDRLFTQKTFSYSLVGTKPGTHLVKVPELTYFDPNTYEYKTLGGSTLKVQVTGGAPDVTSEAAPPAQNSSQQKLQNERLVTWEATVPSLRKQLTLTNVLFGSFAFLVCAALSLVFFKLRSSQKRLHEIVQKIERTDSIQEVRDLFLHVVGAYYNIPVEDTKHFVREKRAQNADKMADEILIVFDKIDSFIYSSITHTDGFKADLKREAIRVASLLIKTKSLS